MQGFFFRWNWNLKFVKICRPSFSSEDTSWKMKWCIRNGLWVDIRSLRRLSITKIEFLKAFSMIWIERFTYLTITQDSGNFQRCLAQTKQFWENGTTHSKKRPKKCSFSFLSQKPQWILPLSSFLRWSIMFVLIDIDCSYCHFNDQGP